MRTLGISRFWMDAPPAVEPLRFRRVPMLAAAVCFAAGILLARIWHTPFLLVTAITLLLLLATYALATHLRVALLPVLAFWTAAGCWCAQMQPPVPTQQALVRYADNLSRTVRGRVVRVRRLRSMSANAAPEEDSDSAEFYTPPTLEEVDLRVDAVEDITPDTSIMQPVEGGVRVAIKDDSSELACGEVLELPLRMHVPEIYRDPGAWSQTDELLQQGISAEASVEPDQIHHVTAGGFGGRCRVYAIQTWASERIEAFAASPANRFFPRIARLDANDTAMLQAMLFGDRSMLRHTLRAGFERTGTFHLFVVSGLHVAVVAGGLFWIFRRFRMQEGWAVAATIALTGGYALLTGFGTPVQRAFVMSAAYLLAHWLTRERRALNALGAAILTVLVLDPRSLMESSFQMTMLVILAIAGVAAPLSERWFSRWEDAIHELWTIRLDAAFPPRTAQLRVGLRMWGTAFANWLGEWARNLPVWALRASTWGLTALLFGTVTEICMMLPMAVYFHRATLLALPLNAVCIPLVGIVLCAAIATFCISLISTTAAALPGAVTALLLHGVRSLVAHLGGRSIADVRVPEPAIAALCFGAAAIAFCCWAFRMRARTWILAGACVLAAVPVAILWPAPAQLHPGMLEVTALDVGQGDCLLVASPDGHTLLVDAGGPVGQPPSEERWDVGEEIVAPYLWSRRIRRLDAILLTHAHSDHMGGMPAILRDFRPRELWLSLQPSESTALRDLLDEARELGVRVRWLRAPETFEWEGLQAHVLSPQPEYKNKGRPVNNDSLVMRLSFGQSSVLLEGDAEAASEASMLAHGLVEPSTLLKVGHHGSKTSTSRMFLSAVAPKDAVISVGRHNTFGHPRFEVLERLENSEVRTFRTDRFGAETFLLDRSGGISAAPAASN